MDERDHSLPLAILCSMNTTLEFKHYFDRLFVNLMKIIYRSAYTTLHTQTHATNYEYNFNLNDLLVYTHTGGTNSSKLNKNWLQQQQQQKLSSRKMVNLFFTHSVAEM